MPPQATGRGDERVNKNSVTAGIVMGFALTVGGVRANAADSGVGVEEGIPKYAAAQGVSGKLSAVGSDTLGDTFDQWFIAFHDMYPSVERSYDPKGSGAAPKALIDGTAVLGPMSREMKPDEIATFENKFGYKPTGIAVALDALAIFVNKDNPLEKLTLQQADAIFSSTRKSGAPADVTTWGQLGLTGEWASRPINLYGRNSGSGTYVYFKEHVLAKGDYKATVKEAPGSSTVVNNLTTDRDGIGYSGIGYRTSGVKAVPIVGKDGAAYDAVAANVYSNKYAISRALFVYVNRAPGKPLSPTVREFLNYVLSREGQEIVIKAGFVPLTSAMVKDYRAKVN
jgi:phosphate transport system substrate-binding protein